MSLIAILEPVPAFFKESLANRGFNLWETNPAELRTGTAPSVEVIGMVIRSKTFVDAGLMDVSKRLRFIMRPGSGIDNVDQSAAQARGIALLTSPEGNCHSVGEHALGMLLALLHNLTKANCQVKNGAWMREVNRGTELRHLIVGIVGCGHTGSAFAEKLQGIGCEVWIFDKYLNSQFYSRYGRPVEYAELMSHADVVSFHVPYNQETHHYFNKSVMERRSKPVIIINTSRGGVVRSQDLLEGLQQGWVQGACLDVLETEDHSTPPADVIQATESLKKQANVIITPHIAGWSHTSEKAIYNRLLDKIEALK